MVGPDSGGAGAHVAGELRSQHVADRTLDRRVRAQSAIAYGGHGRRACSDGGHRDVVSPGGGRMHLGEVTPG